MPPFVVFHLGLIILFVKVFYDLINLTQVHSFMVNAHDMFTFGRLLLFIVSFTGILLVIMQIMK